MRGPQGPQEGYWYDIEAVYSWGLVGTPFIQGTPRTYILKFQ